MRILGRRIQEADVWAFRAALSRMSAPPSLLSAAPSGAAANTPVTGLHTGSESPLKARERVTYKYRDIQASAVKSAVHPHVETALGSRGRPGFLVMAVWAEGRPAGPAPVLPRACPTSRASLVQVAVPRVTPRGVEDWPWARYLLLGDGD